MTPLKTASGALLIQPLFAPSQLNYLPFEANTLKHRWLRKALEALRTAQASLATATREEGDRTNAAIATERLPISPLTGSLRV